MLKKTLMVLFYSIVGLFLAYWIMRIPTILELSRFNHSLSGIASVLILVFTFMVIKDVIEEDE